MKNIYSVGILATALLLGPTASADFRPPSVPIVSCDPFFSIWSGATAPTDCDTAIWFGAKQPITVQVELDGVRYRLMGSTRVTKPLDWDGLDVPALRCDECEVKALTSVYSFTDGKDIEVELSFMTPKMADELDVFSRPVTYGTVKVRGAKSVKTFVEISPALATNDDKAEMVTRHLQVAGIDALAIGRKDQKPLSMAGDRVRCNWGWAYLVNPVSVGAEAHFLLAYDDVESLQFMGDTLQAWWKRDGKPFEAMLAEAVRDRARLQQKAKAFDEEFSRDLKKVGGEKYRDLAALAYRHSFAACQLVASKDAHPLYFSKENTSNGCQGTVDVLYPQLPLLLFTSRTLTRATLEPILVYAASDKWPYDYAPHDVGVYPHGNGQVYNFNPADPRREAQKQTDAERMPVEECGNMLIALCALTEAEGEATLAARYWPTISAWAGYLEKFGFDPGNQLCTDDFAGHLAHNANLSVKSILAFAAYARMAKRLGKDAEAEKYLALAKASVPRWMAAAKGGAEGGYRLAFDQPGTWSMKYNLVWDRVLGFGLFPREVADREQAAYRKLAKPYGLPLDSRKAWTKTDWEFWCAALRGERADLDFITDLVWRYANETPDRRPFPDWYWTHNGRVYGFLGRSVIGGVFMPAYANAALTRKWQKQ